MAVSMETDNGDDGDNGGGGGDVVGGEGDDTFDCRDIKFSPQPSPLFSSSSPMTAEEVLGAI